MNMLHTSNKYVYLHAHESVCLCMCGYKCNRFPLDLVSWFAFYCYDKDHDQKQLREERDYFILQAPIAHNCGQPRQKLKQHRNLEAGTKTGTMEECCLLAHSPWLVQLAFLHTAQDYLPPSHINQKAQQTCLHANLIAAFS